MSTRDEFALIDWIRSQVGTDPRLLLGIGDDTAILDSPLPTNYLITTDLLMEGTHFLCESATPEQIGHKTLAVNLSDLAAMAGKPVAAVIQVAFSRNRGSEFARRFFNGMQQLAGEFGVLIAGGDTNIWDGPCVTGVTLLGEVTDRGAVLRSGAQAGDWILVTGNFGDSLAGHHLDFTPRIHEALTLNAETKLHAMIDVSDGLVADLLHILEESKLGGTLYADKIPRRSPSTTLEAALGDGEDFELLFTLAEVDARQLLQNSPIGIPITHIGTVNSGAGLNLQQPNGESSPLTRTGWEHRW